MLSNINCEVRKAYVYDTVYSEIDSQTNQMIDRMFDDVMDISIFINIDKQKGGTDCGVLCISVTTNYCNNYTQSLLRSHLITCFENFYLTTFLNHLF